MIVHCFKNAGEHYSSARLQRAVAKRKGEGELGGFLNGLWVLSASPEE